MTSSLLEARDPFAIDGASQGGSETTQPAYAFFQYTRQMVNGALRPLQALGRYAKNSWAFYKSLPLRSILKYQGLGVLHVSDKLQDQLFTY